MAKFSRKEIKMFHLYIYMIVYTIFCILYEYKNEVVYHLFHAYFLITEILIIKCEIYVLYDHRLVL